MPWYEWLLLAVGAFIAVTALAFRLLRMSDRGRRFLALPARAKIRFGRTLLSDREVPWTAKLLLVAVVGYIALPFDLIPDFIPVLGQVDDVAIVVLGVGLLILLIPRDRFERALAGAEDEALRRKRDKDRLKEGAGSP
jgi:uncharacterized membrane protein YkvA (DUF1232 family)